MHAASAPLLPAPHLEQSPAALVPPLIIERQSEVTERTVSSLAVTATTNLDP